MITGAGLDRTVHGECDSNHNRPANSTPPTVPVRVRAAAGLSRTGSRVFAGRAPGRAAASVRDGVTVSYPRGSPGPGPLVHGSLKLGSPSSSRLSSLAPQAEPRSVKFSLARPSGPVPPRPDPGPPAVRASKFTGVPHDCDSTYTTLHYTQLAVKQSCLCSSYLVFTPRQEFYFLQRVSLYQTTSLTHRVLCPLFNGDSLSGSSLLLSGSYDKYSWNPGHVTYGDLARAAQGPRQGDCPSLLLPKRPGFS
eukprot:751235-Hanusia_phi.AAC.4